VEVTSKPKWRINTPETIMERARSCNTSSRPSRSNPMEILNLTKHKMNAEESNLYFDVF